MDSARWMWHPSPADRRLWMPAIGGTNSSTNFSCPNSITKNCNEACFQFGNFGFYELIWNLIISSILLCHRICHRPLLVVLFEWCLIDGSVLTNRFPFSHSGEELRSFTNTPSTGSHAYTIQDSSLVEERRLIPSKETTLAIPTNDQPELLRHELVWKSHQKGGCSLSVDIIRWVPVLLTIATIIKIQSFRWPGQPHRPTDWLLLLDAGYIQIPLNPCPPPSWSEAHLLLVPNLLINFDAIILVYSSRRSALMRRGLENRM